MNCSLGDDGILSTEDTCSFTCNTGYELIGSNIRICQKDGRWSGSEPICRRGEIKCVKFWQLFSDNYLLVLCLSLIDPNNGKITCSLGDDEAPSYEDMCDFTCNTGYELTGSDIRTCQSDGSWSGNNTICRRGEMKCVKFWLILIH